MCGMPFKQYLQENLELQIHITEKKEAYTSKVNQSTESSPDQYGSAGWTLFHKAECWFNSLSKHMPRLWVRSPTDWGMCERQPIAVSLLH